MRVLREKYSEDDALQRISDTKNIMTALEDSLYILVSMFDDIGDSDSAAVARDYVAEVSEISNDFGQVFDDYIPEGQIEETEVEETEFVEESLNEDTVKTKDGKWVNKGDTGETHGKFKTKKEADAQRKAMFANNFKG